MRVVGWLAVSGFKELKFLYSHCHTTRSSTMHGVGGWWLEPGTSPPCSAGWLADGSAAASGGGVVVFAWV